MLRGSDGWAMERIHAKEARFDSAMRGGNSAWRAGATTNQCWLGALETNYRGPITRGPQPHCFSHAPRTMLGYSGWPRLPL